MAELNYDVGEPQLSQKFLILFFIYVFKYFKIIFIYYLLFIINLK